MWFMWFRVAGIFTAETQRRKDEEFEKLLENGYKWR
jgi:hypothetical protein